MAAAKGTGVGAEVAAVVSSVEVATAEVVASVKRRRVPRVALRVATVPRVAVVTGVAVEASAAVAVSAARPAPWSS